MMTALRQWANDRRPLITAGLFLLVAVTVLIVISLLRG
jgi:hypothetical protein